MLENYPLEVFRTVISHLDDRADLKSLSEVSRFWNEVTNPFLYRNIFISTERKDHGIIMAHQRAGVLKYTRDIRILCVTSEIGSDVFDFDDCSPCNHGISHDCAIAAGGDNVSDADDMNGWNPYHGFSNAEQADKEQWIDPEGMRHGSWQRQDCIPPEIMGEGGYLPTRQTFIEQLRIRAFNFCDFQYPQLFSRLKRLAVVNTDTADIYIGRYYDVEKLRDCLKLNCCQLDYLEISCLHWMALTLHYDDEYFKHFTEVLVEPWPNRRLRFSNVQHLVLEGYPFVKDKAGLLKDMNPRVLHTLALRSCSFWKDFLSFFSSTETPFHLRTLEVQTPPPDMEQSTEACHNIANFIEKCKPLENLYIAVENAFGLERLWTSLLRHRETLKSFVFYSAFDEQGGSTPYHVPNLSFSPPYYKEVDPERLTLKHLDLELLGVSYKPRYLIPALSPLTAMGNLKVLHIRGFYIQPDYFHSLERTGRLAYKAHHRRRVEAFDNFVQWAFGPEGFRSLKLIAHSGPVEKGGGEVFLCPKVGPDTEPPFPGRNYRHVTKRDHVQHALLRKHAHAFKACPCRGAPEYYGI
ncbi:hypothetical protein MGYG_04069 [Nannizzia gypsea CBS 118893]|uniref:F-box domain-containing protein n=1 Tax=Arthroderma gypseum (strain ATCC MYA-4604 / CBS 118893) TaxID=535722 RepID=E4UUU9_ARTGP|nr:hypothetical protein MGYG_04069 [Nannizzia gypsea CBS 118893]EFR01066.1 hypothetical protein MGYG_04069 [Nannizzia gypsea CBS 118893]